MELATAILFVDDLARMRRFYADVVGLAVADEADGWVRFDAGGVGLALHALPTPQPVTGAARHDAYVKLAFHAADVATERARLIAAGARMREVKTFGAISLCDGLDPEGNVFQISSRAKVG